MISAATVTQVWNRMAATPPAKARRLAEKRLQDQPVALAYLHAVGQQPPFSRHDGELILYIGMVLWQIMKQSAEPLREVSEATLQAAEESSDKFLEVLAS